MLKKIAKEKAVIDMMSSCAEVSIFSVVKCVAAQISVPNYCFNTSEFSQLGRKLNSFRLN